MNTISKIALTIVAVFLSLAGHAEASVSISEIMYDLSGTDTDREWVELHNDSGSTVELDGWKFNDGSNHVLNAPPANGGQGSLEISGGGYIILAGNASTFLDDHPGFSGTVIDTVMSLNNTSDTLALYNGSGTLEDSFTYSLDDGAAGDGNSLQLTGSSWQAGAPTPGEENDVSNSATDDDDGTTTTTGADDEAEIADFVEPEFKAEILSKVIVPAGVPVSFRPLVLGSSNEEINTGLFLWNLGDGTSYALTDVAEFFHTYKTPGEYVIVLEYRHKKTQGMPDDTDTLVLKVFDPKITITNFSADGTISISNGSAYDIDLSGWSLVLEGFKFILPKNSFILAGKTFGLSPEQSSLPRNLARGEILYLYFPDDHIATTYGQVVPPPVPYLSTTNKVSVTQAFPEINTTQISPENDSLAFTTSPMLSASALGATTSNDETKSKTFLYVVMLLGVLCIAIGSVMYIRNTGSIQTKDSELTALGYSIREEE